MLTDHLLCFIDILGFKALVKRAEGDEDLQRDILKILEFNSEFRKMWQHVLDNVKISMFSDLITFFTEDVTEETLHLFVGMAAEIQKNILQLGYASRGIIVSGGLYSDTSQDIIFGPALIKAYEAERDEVYYPRIVVETSLVDKFNVFDGIFQDETDFSFCVDFIDRGSCTFVSDEPTGYIGFVRSLKRIVDDNVNSLAANPKLVGKWIWLQRFLDRKLAELQGDPPSLALQ